MPKADSKSVAKNERGAPDKKTLASGTPGKINWKRFCRPLRALMAEANQHVLKIVGSKLIAAYAVYNIFFGIAGLIFIINFHSVSDVGILRLRQAWISVSSLTCLAILGTCGLVVALLRSVKYSKIYFFLMPLYIVFGVGPTSIMVGLRCRCDSFEQCNALTTFAAASGQKFTNPFPAPHNLKKFVGMANIPWRMPPKPLSGLSLIEQRSAARNGPFLDSIRSSSIASCLIDSYRLSKKAGLIRLFDRNSLELIHDVDLAKNTTKMAATIQIHDVTVTLSTNGTNQPVLDKGVNKKFDRTDPRSAYSLKLGLTASWDHTSDFREHIEGCQKFVRALSIGSAMWARIVKCRKPNVNPKDPGSHCPAEIDQVLQDCALSKTCGAIRITATKDVQNSDIVLTACRVSVPVSIVNTSGAPDNDPFWLQLSQEHTLALYFKKSRIERGLADIRLQAGMTHDQWVAYMAAYKDSQCTCQNSCMAYEEEEDNRTPSFWCKVRNDKAKNCNGLLEKQEESSFRWTKKLCQTRTPITDTRAVLTNVKGQCECAPNMGFKMEGAEKKLIRGDILEAAEKAHVDSPIVGHKCSQWLKEDVKLRRRWCVVGFDSACADRKEKVISLERNLRVWVSSIPCEMESGSLQSILSDASETCSRYHLVWHFADWPKYIVWPFMCFAIYTWSLNRCRDGDCAPEREGGWGRGDSASEGSLSNSRSGSSSDSELEENSDSEKSSSSGDTERKSRSKPSKTQKRDLQFNDESDNSKPKRPARKKQSEWSDDEKPSAKETSHSEMTKKNPKQKSKQEGEEEEEDSDSWMNAPVTTKPKKKKKSKKDEESWSFW